MKNLKDKITAKVEKKTSGLKDKIAAKVKGKCGKACILFAFLLAVAGCHMGEQPTAQRAQTSMVRDNVFNITVVMPTNAVAENAEKPAIHVEVGNQAQVNETSGRETMTASPSNTPTVDTKPDIDVEVPVSKGGSAQSVGSTLGDAAAGFVKGIADHTSTNSAATKELK